MPPVVVFDNVSKKFRRGERHDSLRDLVPALVGRLVRPRRPEALEQGEFWALQNVSFEVEPGRAVGIIGPNGAGKSTTLKLLTRILRPTTGRSAVRGRIGALIEVAAGFHPDLTGRENVYLQGAIMGMKRREIAERLDAIIDFAGVSAFIDTPVKRYSSGMNARLGFSIAAHLRPDVLIIDEVLAVGDMSFQQKCYDRMLEYKRNGIAIVLVSHNLQAVARLCDESVYLAGTVRAKGATSEVLAAYLKGQMEPLTSADTSVRLRSVLLSQTGAKTPVPDHVPAGSQLTLHVEGTAQAPLENVTVGLSIRRATDQLLVYSGHVDQRELGQAVIPATFALDFGFTANLTRGMYALSVFVIHNPTQQFLLPTQQVAVLGIDERRSWEGVADVALRTELAVPRSASEFTGAAR